jgi:tetrahydromethanopterin S-methyltransferase subunit F
MIQYRIELEIRDADLDSGTFFERISGKEQLT